MDIYEWIDSPDIREHLRKMRCDSTPPECAFLVHQPLSYLNCAFYRGELCPAAAAADRLIQENLEAFKELAK